MPYSICGLVVRSHEVEPLNSSSLTFVRLMENLSLLPIEQKHILLIDGDETEARADFEINIPTWLDGLARRFSECAYIEADIWGGTGMQAGVVFQGGQVFKGPVISSAAINFSLRHLGVVSGSDEGFLSALIGNHKDAFDKVGLGRFRSVEGWKNAAEQCAGSRH